MSKELTKYDRDVYLAAMKLLKQLLETMEKHLPKESIEETVSVRDHLKTKPNCYECLNRRSALGSAHSECINYQANVTGDSHGIKSGWFFWPYNFDPTWLITCDSFKQK